MLALDTEEPTLADVVLGGDNDPHPGPGTAVDLEIPVAPSLVHQDQVLAGGDALPEPVQDRLLLEAVLAPERQRERALAPRQRQHARSASPHRLRGGKTADPPAISFDATEQRAQIRQQRDHQTPTEEGGGGIHARAPASAPARAPP